MKHIISFLLTIAASFFLVPAGAFAIEPDEPDFEAHLKEIGWEKKDYLNYLEGKGWSLADFESADELGTPLTEESILEMMDTYELTRGQLNELLSENGDIEEGQDVLEGTYLIFAEDVDTYVDFYMNGWEGTPIDEKNLAELLDVYGFQSREELEQFLREHDDSIENYEYIEDLDYSLDFYINGSEAEDAISDLFSEIGLTDEEIEALFNYLSTLELDDPVMEEEMIKLSERMMAFEEFESLNDLSAEQMAELLDIFKSMLDLLQIKTDYYIVKDGNMKPVSLKSIFTVNVEKGSRLLIKLSNLQEELLADILVTAEMFGSDLIQETGRDLKEANQIVKEHPIYTKSVIETKPAVKTVKGGELPKTAANAPGYAFGGIMLILAGTWFFRKYSKQSRQS
ncbi:processed acidic surface protein [Metabacillus sp. JX24]|uniref:processed acidic surface protein n=1 Tax=Metabacillus sp. JX24 TaxID=3240759 RepID=UPI00350FC930